MDFDKSWVVGIASRNDGLPRTCWLSAFVPVRFSASWGVVLYGVLTCDGRDQGCNCDHVEAAREWRISMERGRLRISSVHLTSWKVLRWVVTVSRVAIALLGNWLRWLRPVRSLQFH